MNDYSLFQRSRLKLALWYAGLMALILSLSGFSIYRFLIQSNWRAVEQEIEAIAGTLHDSLEPILPASQEPEKILQRILPELCLVGKPCHLPPTLIQRHTTGISDYNTYYIRLFNHQGKLLAFSPNQPSSLPKTLNQTPWQTFSTTNGIRYHQFTTILHSANVSKAHSSWGYLQLGRTLELFDAEIKRMQWILLVGFPITLGLIAISSWWLSGLAIRPLYQSYQQQRQFTANAAHELRSPLASLLATVEAMLRIPQSNPQEMQTMLYRIERQGRRLSHLIADLLFLTSLEQNSLPKSFHPCCLNDLVNDLIEELLELATASDIHLTCQVPQEEIFVLGNESQLYRLVSNLIVNAIQYTKTGGLVMVNLESSDRFAFITVKDTGTGIAPEEQNRIFERFYRIDSARSRKTGGTGLGLAIARAIVHHHQGHLTVKSELRVGSLFTIHLPCLHQRM